MLVWQCSSSIHGWDSVVSGLVMVGFHLLDTFSPKTAGEISLRRDKSSNAFCSNRHSSGYTTNEGLPAWWKSVV